MFVIEFKFDPIGWLALLVSVVSILFTIYRTRKSDKNEIEDYRHKIINILIKLQKEMERNWNVIDKLVVSNSEDTRFKHFFKYGIDKVINANKELRENIVRIKGLIEKIKDDKEYSDLDKLRQADEMRISFESNWSEEKSEFEIIIKNAKEVLTDMGKY